MTDSEKIRQEVERVKQLNVLFEKFKNEKTKFVFNCRYGDDDVAFNADGTDNRYPCCEIPSWTAYWQILSHQYKNEMECASCGKKIFAHIDTDECYKAVKQDGNDKPENHQCHGSHLKIGDMEPYFIVPLCPDCNGKHGQRIGIRKGTVAVVEVDAVIRNKE